MMPPKPGRPRDFVRWLLVLVVIAIVAGAVWYQQVHSSLPCAAEAGGNWGLTYADGNGVSGFRWAIQPRDPAQFVRCLQTQGYGVVIDAKTGCIRARDHNGHIVTNSLDNAYVDQGIFYRL